MSYLQPFNYTYIPSLGLGQSIGGGFQHSTAFEPVSRFTSYNSNNNNAAQQSQQQYQNPNIPQIPIPNSIMPNVNNPNGGDYYGNPVEQQQYYTNDAGSNQYGPKDAYNSLQPQPKPQRQQQQPLPVRKRKAKKVSQRNVDIPFNTPVTPIQGPIYIKDGLVPVVPLYSYPAVNNGSLYQIPILWTALSVALGLEIRGEILRGLPCIKRLNQLFCPTAGNTYPLDPIERFIDENKALIKRMYGEFVMINSDAFSGPVAGNYLRRSAREIYEHEVPDYFTKSQPNNLHTTTTGGNATVEDHLRNKRQTVNPRNGGPTQQPKSNRVDSCESKVEITTPYWAANSGGKVRAIVNTQHFEQAIHQEVCAKTTTGRCTGDCGCEQKYKWHRLLAYDPDNDCKGIFMDWFLFPSCCVCRCNPQT